MKAITHKRRNILTLEVFLSCIGLALTSVFSFLVFEELLQIAQEFLSAGRYLALCGHALFSFIVASLLYGGLVYQLTRLSCYARMLGHKELPFEALFRRTSENSEPLAILIPSYKEEREVVFRTLLSAALQSYPKKRVVLLLDDPPVAKTNEDREGLRMARELPNQVAALLAEPFDFVTTALDTARGLKDTAALLHELQSTLLYVESWFRSRASELRVDNHESRFFREHILLERAEFCAKQRRLLSEHTPDTVTAHALSVLQYLQSTFSVELCCFERKRFENLSHEPNKAMNLNSYLGILGKSFRIEERGTSHFLIEDTAASDLVAPTASFVLTLDADSVLVPDYACKLISFLEQPQNGRYAVVQTPYNAFPGAQKALERFASATTDIQYVIHQGFTAAQATYWVGANALLRVKALQDIVVEDRERGHLIQRYIQDRTVIEDTESSIDLVAKGWKLHNYPERLAFSSTPPDLGSLIIQRQRWANGGLIILPKLLRYLLQNCFKPRSWIEGFMRVHYLISIALVNFGLLIVLLIPFTENIRSIWLPCTALPYFLLYARDLKLSGYRYRDLLGVYSLNLMLIPINISGVLKSLEQMMSREKIPFRRTPKVGGRTAAGAWYLLAHCALALQWTLSAGIDLALGRTVHAVFAFANMLMLVAGMVFMVGVANIVDDIWLEWRPVWRIFRRKPFFRFTRRATYTTRMLLSRS